jgi:DNA-binding NtrC family response regulator
MAEHQSNLDGKRILAVDDEADILETIQDILDMAEVDVARDYNTASEKIRTGRYDLAILDIMGVNGLVLLEEAVARGIPSVMLTAHAINPDTLMSSIRKGAISYLPKETLAELDELLEELLAAHAAGNPPLEIAFQQAGFLFRRAVRTGLESQG